MANRIVSVHAGIYGMGIYTIMLPSSGFSVAHYRMSASYCLHIKHTQAILEWCRNIFSVNFEQELQTMNTSDFIATIFGSS